MLNHVLKVSDVSTNVNLHKILNQIYDIKN